MSMYETIRKQYIEASEAISETHRKYNEIVISFYAAYINSDRVKNIVGKCFKNKETNEVIRVIEPSFLRRGRNMNSFTENEYVCLIVEPELEFVPEDFQEYNPINLDNVYIAKSEKFEEISLEEFKKKYNSALETFNKFLEQEIETAKNYPLAKSIYRF